MAIDVKTKPKLEAAARENAKAAKLVKSVDDAAAAIDALLDKLLAETPVGKDDGGTMTDGDLEAGGMAQPAQGVTPKERRNYRGIEIVIDRPIGFKQAGVDANGNAWEREYKADYGYFPGTLGGDGEELDVFLGKAESDTSYWAVQRKADGTFDEYKVFLGYESREAAEQTYKDHIPMEYLASMTEVSFGLVKALRGVEPAEVLKRLVARAIGEQIQKQLTRTVELRLAGALDLETPSGEMAWLNVAKADTPAPIEQRYVLGPVLIPDVVDAQGDRYASDVIEAAAWGWMATFRNTGVQHRMLANDVIVPVESYVVREDTTIGGRPVRKGTWVLGAIIKDDALWDGVKRGAFTGWSIGGFAKKVGE